MFRDTPMAKLARRVRFSAMWTVGIRDRASCAPRGSREEAVAMFDATIEDNGLLPQIREGMTVRDSGGDTIGKVERVQMGGGIDPADAERQSREAAGPSDEAPGAYDAPLITNLADTVASGGSDGIPDEARQDLERKGYIEIDSKGLFSANRFAAADQIASVSGDDVVLNVAGDVLTKSR
jgi:hypothetical protein